MIILISEMYIKIFNNFDNLNITYNKLSGVI
jgi:hypothetical protein